MTDPAKVKKVKEAAARDDRPGDECDSPPGVWWPIVERAVCEGKNDCVAVCPYDVFEVRRMDDADFRELGFFAKLKILAHGRKTAYTPKADQCRACGLCVVACPEGAIMLDDVAP